MPVCVAETVQSPADKRLKTAPLTLQTAPVLVEKLTDKPELALAVKLKAPAPKVRLPGSAKLMVCASRPAELVMLKLRVTGVAAA